MRKHILIACTILGALTFASCDSGTSNEQETQTTDEVDEAIAGATDSLTTEKRELIPFTARASMLQVELGQLAAEKGQSNEVKQYGQQMVDFYSSKKEELADFAERYGASLPQTLSDDHREKVQTLRDKKPEEFDMAYWDEVIDAHKEAIDEFDSTLKPADEAMANPFSLWARNTKKEKQAQMEQAMAIRLDQKEIMRKRSGL